MEIGRIQELINKQFISNIEAENGGIVINFIDGSYISIYPESGCSMVYDYSHQGKEDKLVDVCCSTCKLNIDGNCLLDKPLAYGCCGGGYKFYEADTDDGG